MTRLFSRYRSIVLLIYLAGGTLIELAHDDAAALMIESRPVMTPNMCGEMEMHIPFDQARHCLACSPLAQRLALAVVQFIGIEPARVEAIAVSLFHLPTSQPDLTSYGKRGPPCV